MTSLTHRASSAAIWSALEISSRYGIQLVVTIVLARFLTPQDFGQIALVLVFTAIGSLLTDGGFGSSLIQNRKIGPNDETTVFLVTSAIASICAGVLWAGSQLVASFFDQPDLGLLIRVMTWVLPLGALAAVPDALLTRQLDFRARTHAQAFASLISGGAAVTAAWLGAGIWSLVLQGLLAAGARAALLWLFSGWRPRGRFDVASLKKLFGFGGYMLLARLLDTVSVRLQSVLIGKLFDTQVLGYYTLAQSAQNAPLSFASGILNRLGLPVFASIADRPDALRSALRRSLQVSMFVFMPVMLGLAISAKPLIILVYGEKWAPAAPILTLLALAGAAWPMHILNLSALSAQGHSKLFFNLEVAKKLIFIGLIAVGGLYGPIAIAGAVLLSSLIGVCINTLYSNKLLAYSLRQQLCDQAATTLLSVGAAVPAWVILHYGSAAWFTTAMAISAAAVTYLVLSIAFNHPALAALFEMAKALQRPSQPLTPPTTDD